MNPNPAESFFQVTDKYEAVIHVRLFQMIEAYITNHTDELGRVSFPSDPWSRVPYNFHYDIITRHAVVKHKLSNRDFTVENGRRYYTLLDDWRTPVMVRIIKEAEMIVAAWQTKMLDKLTLIFKHREDIEGFTTVGTHSQGMFRVDFKNGDSFVVETKMIINVSKNGKLFNQWPSTFSSIHKGDAFYKKQSEKWMKEWF